MGLGVTVLNSQFPTMDFLLILSFLRQVEENNFWFKVRNRILIGLIKSIPGNPGIKSCWRLVVEQAMYYPV